MTLIEVLVVMGILATIAGIVAVMIPKVNFARDKTLCMEHVRTLASLLEMGGRADLAGPALLLHLADHGDLRGADSLGKLFCPGDQVDRFPGTEAYREEGRDPSRLTSYAARDPKHPEWARQRSLSDVVVLLADDSEDHHDGRGVVVGLTGGAAKWRDKVDDYGLSTDAALAVGEGSDVPELACLR